MNRLYEYRSIANPSCGVREVTFSRSEIKKFRASNLRNRNTGTHVNFQRDIEIDA